MIDILIVEDMILLRDSLTEVIDGQEDMRVAGVVSRANEALDMCRTLAPGLVLLDVVSDGKADGIEAAAEIRRELPDIKIVIMTAMPEITFIDAARNAGAHSFIYKNTGSRHLLYVIRSTMSGIGIYPGPDDETLLKNLFSDDQIKIMRLVCQGKSRKEISAALSISEGVVKTLVSDILHKTGFDNIMKFSIYALARGFILPDK